MIRRLGKTKKNAVIVVLLFAMTVSFIGAFLKSGEIAAAADVEITNSCPVNTTSYNLDDNTDYKIPSLYSSINPLGGNFASVSLDVNTANGGIQDFGTRIIDGKTVNRYGIVVGNGNAANNAILDIKMNFNKTVSFEQGGDLDGEAKINGANWVDDSGWYLSNDSAQKVGKDTVGVINSGALVIAKSYDGKDWTWQREGFNSEIKTNFHTTDFVTGRSTSGMGFAAAYGTDKFSVYTPSGRDISKGVYIKIVFAYEIKYAKYSYHTEGILWWAKRVKDIKWQYRNILEESVFYLASNSATVTFNNASDDNPPANGTSEIVKQIGTIKDGHGTSRGFRLNKLNNSSFTVRYRHVKPAAAPTNVWADAYDGQFFSETGRYDFQIITSLGDKYINPDTETEYYSVYVNNMDVNSAVNLYFGNPNNIADANFITGSSARVYSIDDDIPVYVAGKTYYKVNAVSPAYMAVAGKIYKDGDRANPIRVFDGGYSQSVGTITEPGYYEAEFYSNKDYERDMSGDIFHFIFKFKVIAASEVSGPSVNQLLLNNIVTASDLQGSYQSVSVPTAGAGNAIFAFGDFQSAYGFAYEYERGKVAATQSGYSYGGQNFTSQFDVLDKVDENARALVVKRYFDASDLNSYLTISDIAGDVTQIDVAQNIIVFSDDTVQKAMKCGEPSLNDRKIRTLNPSGGITQEIIPYMFIQVADFESNGVILTHESTNNNYPVVYGVSVEQQLKLVNAPSGRYKITETNKGGIKSEYYAVYTAPNDNTAGIQIDKFYNGGLTSKNYTRQDANLPVIVNGFILKSAANNNDSETLIKVYRDNALIFIGTTQEVNGQVFTSAGDYAITLVDRLGNSYSLPFYIYTEKKSSTLSLYNDGVIETKTVFEGQTITLTTPAKSGFVFKGWQNGTARYDGTYIAGNADTTLSAVWHYPSVTISLYDGTLYNTLINNVEDVRTLPFLTKDGYTLVGWLATFTDGTGRFYYGQISSVPNVPSIRLDAVWKKNTTTAVDAQNGTNGQAKITLIDGNNILTLTANYGAALALPTVAQAGMIFLGWQYEITGTNGIIYTTGKIDGVQSVPQIVLTALYTTDPNGGGSSGAGGTVGGEGNSTLNTGTPVVLNKDVLLITISVLAFMLLLVLIVKKSKQNLTSTISSGGKSLNGNVYVFTEDKEYRRRLSLAKKQARKEKYVQSLAGTTLVQRKGFWKIFVPVLSCALMLVMGGEYVLQTFAPSIRHAQEQQAVQAQIDKQSEEYNNLFGQLTEQNTDNDLKYDTALLTRTMTDYSTGGLNLSEEEQLIVALAALDIINNGYEIFSATAITQDGREYKGLGYSDYAECTVKDGVMYISASFIGLPRYIDGSGGITYQDYSDGVIIISDDDTANYILDFQESYATAHFVYLNRYIKYDICNFGVTYSTQQNTVGNYDLSLGVVYNYDLTRVVYDPDLGRNNKQLYAQTINTYPDYETVRNSFRSYVTEQNNNGLQVNTMSSSYISYEALNEWRLNNQDETFLGITAEEIYQFESNLTKTEYYVVTINPDTGANELTKVEFPPPPPERRGWLGAVLDFLNDWGGKFLSVGMIIGGMIVTCVAGPVVGGALIGGGLELFTQCVIEGKKLTEVNWLKVAVATAAGALSGIPGVGILGAGLISGTLFAAESIWEHRGNLGSWESWLDVGLDFLDGFMRGASINNMTQTMGKLFCFTAGTAVATIGGYKAIENIRVGDLVLSYNETTKQNEYKEVTQLFSSQHDKLTKITDSNGQTITSSYDHSYYTQRGWISANNLRAGDILQSVNGEVVVVEFIEHVILENPHKLYNFAVDGNHNYYVAQDGDILGSDYILVHNNMCTEALKQGTKDIFNGILSEAAKQTLKKVAVNAASLALSVSVATTRARIAKNRKDNGNDEPFEIHHIVCKADSGAANAQRIYLIAFPNILELPITSQLHPINNEINKIDLNRSYHRYISSGAGRGGYLVKLNLVMEAAEVAALALFNTGGLSIQQCYEITVLAALTELRLYLRAEEAMFHA